MSHDIHMTEITRLEHEMHEGQAPHGVEKITSHYCDLGKQWVAFAPHCLGFLCRSKSATLFNVDSIENKSGTLQYYTALAVQMGQWTINMSFFLTELGEHKAILGYPWFAAMQPNINWK
jgi:hypothetical protein